MRAVFILLALFGSALSAPVLPEEAPEEQTVQLTPELKFEMIRDLQNEVLKTATLKAIAETIKLEQIAEDKLLEAAVETLEEEPSPERTEKLKEVEKLLKRDKRAVQLLNGILGGSSGGGGAEAGASAGSDLGSLLNLVGPILGSSSGGGGGGGTGGDAGSGSGSILNLAVPLLSSSSGGGGDGEGEDGDGAGGSSDLSSLLSLVGPLLGSSSGGGGGADAEGGASASAGSDSGSILNLIGPLLGSSSGGGAGDSEAGGSSNLGSILSLSTSSKGGHEAEGGVAVVAGVDPHMSLLSSLKGPKFALVGDKIQLLMRVKFGILNKILTTLTNKIAAASLPAAEVHSLQGLHYPH
ncbi:keratin, type I cytoskeletal 10-like [Cimex lectularius]|uniref:Uncharacterized protein n=1 Tax=Cimex lectularius TaxID=79782 RepID=A0A8I6SNI5_CIMLE|nr:keratin, type I cytoskeletal 10-like [Cimex lectularius]